MVFKRHHKHKFGDKQVTYDGIKFQSTLEGNYYNTLKAMQSAGFVLFFLRQVPFHLPGNVTYRCDFQVFYADGRIRFIDVKGYETPEFIMKKKRVESMYPIEIEVEK